MQHEQQLDCNQILDKLYLGSEDAACANIQILTNAPYHFTHVLVCGFGLPQPYPEKLIYKKIKAIDLPVYNICQHLPECCQFIDDALEQGGTVLVHCARGVSRSAAIVIGYLMHAKHMSYEEAYYGVVRKARPCALPNVNFSKQLQEWGKQLQK